MNEYKLLSYTAVDGIPTFTDSFIRGLFERMEKEDLVHRVFYDGTVSTPDQFLLTMKHGMNRLFVVEFGGEIAGFCWLNNFTLRTAEFHFCFFENLRGQDAVDVGKSIISAMLAMEDGRGNPLFDLLFGMTAVDNTPARFWCKAMGFGYLGMLPSAAWNAELQQSVAAHYWYAERGKWNG